MHGFGTESAATLESLAHDGATHPWQAVKAALAHVAARDAGVRAWAHVATLDALRGEEVPPGGSLPLRGVPFGVKDVIDVAGMPTRCGSTATPDQPSAFDASCVSLLRRAGAVPIGKTVTAEYAFRAPGPTRNPHAPDHTPGGSSSGSAAAVAAGMVPFALGTQTGGSMIRPAAYCGVVGFKPSFGGVFRDGLALTCESLDVIGWHTRCVADAQSIARILLPYPPSGAGGAALPRRVAVVSSSPDQALELESADALRAACLALQRHGVQCVDIPFDEAHDLARMHGVIMHYEFARSLEPVVRRRAEQLSAGLRDTVRLGFDVSTQAYFEQRRLQATWRMQWERLFGDADLVLTPSAPGAAPRGLESTGTSAFNRIWSVLGWPCLHLPTGKTPAGLPVGVQLVGRFESDHDLLAWGRALHPLLQAAA